MPTIALKQGPAQYREWGSGSQVILMLHGWPADSSHYSELAPKLAQAGWRVIVPDFPGWGETPQPTEAWSVNDYMKWVQSLVEALKLPPFLLFGHSFGGRVAIKYVLAYPYQVRALTLCAAAGLKPDAYTVKRRALRLAARTGKAVFTIPGLRIFSGFMRRALYHLAGSNDYLKAEGVMKQTIVKVLEEDLSPLIPEIKHPTLLLWGSEDGATPLSDGQEMAKRIPRSTLRVFPGLRHNLPKLAPNEVAQAIIEFDRSEAVQAISEA